ncbi:MAG: TonB-dependent receptor plug domain-containing protein, partial [Flavobacteriales bacterium]
MAGASSFLVIRGQNTILGNNQPLFVIDGIPIDNSQLSSSNPNNGRNGFLDSVGNSNRAIDIPQEDIESVTVLKGAAATALYGSLASGGAIIITTKRGKSGKKGLNINVNSGWEWSQYNKMVPLQNKFAQGVSGEYYGPESGLSYSWGPSMDSLVWVQDPSYIHDRNGYIAGVNQVPAGSSTKPVTPYNNVDNFFRNGFKHYYNVDLSGASDKTDYFLSTGYEHTDGIVPNNSFQKFNVGFNGGIKLTKNTSVRSSVKYIRSGGVRIEQGSNVSGVMLGLLRTPASYDNSNGYGEDAADNPESYQFADGTQRKYRYGNRGYDNPFWTVNKNPLRDKVNRIIGNVEITQQIRPWLKAVERIGLDFYSDYRNQSFAIGSRQFSLGQVTENNFTNTQVNNDLIFIANNKIGENISFNTTLGFNMFSSSLTQVYVQGDVL